MKKKIVFFLAIMFTTLFAFSSCSKEEEEASPELKYNVSLSAAGEGEMVAELFDHGRFEINGKAEAILTIANDTVVNLPPNSAVNYRDVLMCPSDYTEAEVAGATKVDSTLNSSKIITATGKWEVTATGYAKYGEIYFVIDEHWPKDTANADFMADTAVIEDVDTDTVNKI